MDRLIVFDVGLFVLNHPAENARKFVRNVVDDQLLRLPLLALATEVFRESILGCHLDCEIVGTLRVPEVKHLDTGFLLDGVWVAQADVR
jgi:hypothetical protein